MPPTGTLLPVVARRDLPPLPCALLPTRLPRGATCLWTHHLSYMLINHLSKEGQLRQDRCE